MSRRRQQTLQLCVAVLLTAAVPHMHTYQRTQYEGLPASTHLAHAGRARRGEPHSWQSDFLARRKLASTCIPLLQLDCRAHAPITAMAALLQNVARVPTNVLLLVEAIQRSQLLRCELHGLQRGWRICTDMGRAGCFGQHHVASS